MAVTNKVVLGTGEVLLDLTADTVTADAVISGRSLHLASGETVTGTLEFPVTSVNGKTGAVTLNYSDVGAMSGDTEIPDAADVASWGFVKTDEVPTEATVTGWGFTKNEGTVTGVTMNGESKGTSGIVDLGTVITEHQDISGKMDKTDAITTAQIDALFE